MIDLTALIGPSGAPSYDLTFRVFPRLGPERWLLEVHYRRPLHLETWPQANRRARIIYRVARILGAFGLHLPSRQIVLRIAQGSPYDIYRQRFDALAVFLGTAGPNRKFVVFAKEGDTAWFIKLPIGAQTFELARAEAATLNALAEDAELAGLVPRCFWIGDALALEDVRSTGATYATLENDEVLRVHDLLFARSQTEVPIGDLSRRLKSSGLKTTPHPDHDIAARIDRARKAAGAFLDTLPPNTNVSCYEAHGDFTRWNVLRAPDGTARIIDWELFGLRPRLFDPFHYIVSQSILVDRAARDAILKQIDDFAALHSLGHSSNMIYFGLYLVSQVIYYSNVYEHQEELNAQLYWTLETWTDLLVYLTSTRLGETTDGYPAGTKSIRSAQ